MKINFSIATVQEKLAALPPAHKALLLVVTLAVMGAAFYYLHYQDQLATIRRLNVNIAEQEKKLASLKQAAARVDVLQKELQEAEEEFSQLLSLLPDQKEIPGLLENVSRLGSKVGLENILFQPQPEVYQEFYATIPVRLDLVGTFNDIGVFFDSVSKLDRILKVDSLTLTRQRDKGVGLLQAACTVVTYRFLETPMPKKAVPGAKK
jgi:type IV pilus assembly protein PilO